MTGLPCTGKSTIAEAVAELVGATVLSADPIDAALLAAGVNPEQRPDIVGFEVMKSLARTNLALGLSVVVDAVHPFESVRQDYLKIAQERSAAATTILTTCSDPAVHRRRVEDRRRRGEKEIDWAGVQRQIDYYELPDHPGLVLDALDDVEQNVAAAVGRVESSR